MVKCIVHDISSIHIAISFKYIIPKWDGKTDRPTTALFFYLERKYWWLSADCSNSSALAMDLLQFCTKHSIYTIDYVDLLINKEDTMGQNKSELIIILPSFFRGGSIDLLSGLSGDVDDVLLSVGGGVECRAGSVRAGMMGDEMLPFSGGNVREPIEPMGSWKQRGGQW